MTPKQAPRAPAGHAPGTSLRARAIDLLSRREHSRIELARKLSRHTDNAGELDALLDELERGQWLSNARFAENLVRRRAPLQGTARIVRELREHGLAEADIAQWRDNLQSSELERARAVWQKKFGSPPADARDYARQYRFMTARGFSHDCLRRLVGDFESQ